MEEQICVTIQMGFLKEHVNVGVSMLDMAIIRDKAKQFLEKHFPHHKLPQQDKMLLFRHNYDSQNMLQLLTAADQINNGSVVEIVLSSKNEKPLKPHIVNVQSYYSPTFCDYCGEILVGIHKQGLKCTKCNRNFHKKCAFASNNNCCASNTSPPLGALHHQHFAQPDQSPANSTNGFGLPHTFVVHTYRKPTVCKFCNSLLVGVVKQGLKCRDCGLNVHKKCAKLFPYSCHALEPFEIVRDPPLPPDIIINHIITEEINGQHEQTSNCQQPMDVDPSDLIPLGRIPGQASRQNRNKPPAIIIEGWMLHSTNKNPTKKRHYWRMDNRTIKLFHDKSLNRCYKVIPLSDILEVLTFEGDTSAELSPPHCIEIRTINSTIFVGENLDWYSKDKSPRLPRRESGIGMESALKWYEALRDALFPPQHTANRANAKLDSLEVKEVKEAAFEFGQLYQILSDDVLGTGQFGTVCSGIHRLSKREVAIKEIVKDRNSMSRRWKDALRNEVSILQKLNFPGIITLEAMFEFSDKIFVVMEKMKADMLEMILSNKDGRLPERNTKFIIVQILKALKYLHEQDIAHCDLKPENVLLSSAESDFPQTKLCDFGYARIIGENSFRKTVVGTPAYLAPEVLQKRGYNKSLDMWSVGVVIYVTLSGTFPFNEGEEIEDQIQNAAFMFPANPWKEISNQAINLISNLLQLKPEHRLSIDQCVVHPWLQDPQLFADLRALELQLDKRYLTTADDEMKWSHHRPHYA